MNLIVSILILTLSLKVSSLINGKPLSEKPDLVRIVFENGWMCSGFFIDQFTILTASHCLGPPAPGVTPKISKILSANDQLVSVAVVALKQHPHYSAQFWPAYDIGVIKTTENKNFKGEFHLAVETKKFSGHIILFGTGKYDLEKNLRARLSGENSFFAIGSVLFFLGKRQNVIENLGIDTSVAPNDSGGPVVDATTQNVIAVMTTTTLLQSIKYGLPAVSTATSVTSKENLNFLTENLGLYKD